MSFYEKYLMLCDKNKKTPSGAALEMGLSKTTVNRWKNGGGITDANILKVATFFGVPKEELKDEPEQKEKPSTPEDAEREAHGKAILDKYNMLDPATQAMFESMLDAAIAAQEKKNGQ